MVVTVPEEGEPRDAQERDLFVRILLPEFLVVLLEIIELFAVQLDVVIKLGWHVKREQVVCK